MKKALSVLLVLMMATALFAGCGTTAPAASSSEAASEVVSSEAASSEAPAGLSGTVTLTGSTSMQALVEALIESFKEVEPGVVVECQYPGSGPGMTAAADGTVDIGNASRDLKPEEAEKLEPHVVAIDGVAAVVNPANAVAELTSDQIAKIFKGEITNWKDVGGADKPIVVIGRDSASGTREAFESLLGIAEACKYAQEINSTGGVKTQVASTPDAIGYISLDAVDETVKAVTLDGVAPSSETVLDGTYKLQRPFVMATNKANTLSAQAQAFLDFALSDAGKAVAADVGLVTK